MASWVSDELSTLSLGDVRREDRLKQVIERMADNPTGSIPQVFSDTSDVIAAYRLLSNAAFEPEAVYDALCESTVSRVREESALILVAHDTTSLDYTKHSATEGLGPIGGGNDGTAGQGIFVHSSMAVTSDGLPLGLLNVRTWTRDPEQVGLRHSRHERPITEKESHRWLEGLAAASRCLPQDREVLHIADREADIFELFAAPRPQQAHLLIRATRERCLSDGAGNLWDVMAAMPQAGTYTITVRQYPDHKPREARLAVRYRAVTLKPPAKALRHNPDLEEITMTAIWVTELDPPKAREPIDWQLLTDLTVADLAAARELVSHYTRRWLIERFHYTLKSGCGTEDSQLRTAERLQRLLALYCVVAWRLLWMTYVARGRGDHPCTTAFADVEWQVMYRYHHGKQPLPDQPPPLRDVVLWMAQLGGFLARKGDGDPGVKVLWRGLIRLQDIVTGYLLTH